MLLLEQTLRYLGFSQILSIFSKISNKCLSLEINTRGGICSLECLQAFRRSRVGIVSCERGVIQAVTEPTPPWMWTRTRITLA